jgi:hypothetical protein
MAVRWCFALRANLSVQAQTSTIPIAKPMRFLLRKNIGGRKFQCLDCEGDDP